MCGRYALTKKQIELIREMFELIDNEDFSERYNIAPGQDVPIIASDQPDKLIMAHWGLIPHWAKDKKIGYNLINARCETVGEKPAFRASFKSKRCLVIADSFYEWRKMKGGKQPYRIM